MPRGWPKGKPRSHGHAPRGRKGDTRRSLTYMSWEAMLARCYREAHPWYHLYGGRGIEVCERWHRGPNGFANFLADMGERPSKEMTLDREDSNKNYEKDNCRWATKAVQRANQRPKLGPGLEAKDEEWYT